MAEQALAQRPSWAKKRTSLKLPIHWLYSSYLLFDISRLKYRFTIYIYVPWVFDKVPNTIFTKTKKKKKPFVEDHHTHKPGSHSSLLDGQVAAGSLGELLLCSVLVDGQVSLPIKAHSLEMLQQEQILGVFFCLFSSRYGLTLTWTSSQLFQARLQIFPPKTVQVLLRNPALWRLVCVEVRLLPASCFSRGDFLQ